MYTWVYLRGTSEAYVPCLHLLGRLVQGRCSHVTNDSMLPRPASSALAAHWDHWGLESPYQAVCDQAGQAGSSRMKVPSSSASASVPSLGTGTSLPELLGHTEDADLGLAPGWDKLGFLNFPHLVTWSGVRRGTCPYKVSPSAYSS